jgi:hypothetical protein
MEHTSDEGFEFLIVLDIDLGDLLEFIPVIPLSGFGPLWPVAGEGEFLFGVEKVNEFVLDGGEEVVVVVVGFVWSEA